MRRPARYGELGLEQQGTRLIKVETEDGDLHVGGGLGGDGAGIGIDDTARQTLGQVLYRDLGDLYR